MWLIHLLLFILTDAHLLRIGVLHINHGLPRARRIRWMVRGCRGDHGVSGSGDAPQLYCIWDALVLDVRFAYLESHGRFDD